MKFEKGKIPMRILPFLFAFLWVLTSQAQIIMEKNVHDFGILKEGDQFYVDVAVENAYQEVVYILRADEGERTSVKFSSKKDYYSQAYSFSFSDKDDKMEKVIRMKIEVSDASKQDLKELSKKVDGDMPVNNDLEFNAMEFKPNPTKGQFDLMLDLKNSGETSISLFDAQGKKIFEEVLKNLDSVYEQSFDIRDESAGIYFLNIQQGNKGMTKKIVKE
jgi:hypothetical protein